MLHACMMVHADGTPYGAEGWVRVEPTPKSWPILTLNSDPVLTLNSDPSCPTPEWCLALTSSH